MLGKVLLIILIMNVGQSPLLRIPLHFVSSSGHQAVHHIQRIVADTFQDKSANNDGEEVTTGAERDTFHQNYPAGRAGHIHCTSAPGLAGHQGQDLGGEIIRMFGC